MPQPVPSGRSRLLLTGALITAFVLSALGSYTLGFRKGSATLSTLPPGLLNHDTSGEPGLAVVEASARVDFGYFWKTWHVLEKNFVPAATSTAGASTTEERVVGAIEGLVRSYHDPYTVFIPKKEADAFKEHVNGEFEGIGAVLTTKDGITRVEAVLPKSPAEAAGITKGTTILAVDGVPVSGLALNEIIPRIRGAKGTIVTLTTNTDGDASDIAITRGTVAIPTTATKVVAAGKDVVAAIAEKARERAAAMTGAVSSAAAALIEKEAREAAAQEFFVLQLAGFAKSSTDAFIADLTRFAESDTPYLIIDLRNNPGGYLDVAGDLASYFLPKGALVVTDRSGAESRVTEYRSRGYPLLSDIASRRIVVLLNRNSASASEILAGALQDHGLAKVVGERSFGKGSVQTLVDIGDIGSLKVTISRWYTPKGRNITETGIVPDIAVDLSDPKYASSTDPYMDSATEALLDDTLWSTPTP